MSDESERPRRKTMWLIVVVLVVFMLYPLSMGPMSVVHDRSSAEVQVVLRAIYSPLARLSTKTGLDEFLDKYMKWWDTLLDP